MILLVFFGLLAILAAWSTWHDEDLRWVGLWLLGGFGFSNILHANFPVTALPGPYSLIEIMVLLAAAIAWDLRRYWPLLVIGGVNVLSICFNIAFAAHSSPGVRQIFLFELTTNLCFTAECLLAIGTGIYDGLRSGRLAGLSLVRRRNLAPHVAGTAEKAE